MSPYSKVVVVLLMVECTIVRASPPLRLTIDCGSRTRESTPHRLNQLDVKTFCSFLHHAIPKAVKDGKFVLLEQKGDQEGFSNDDVPVLALPPKGFVENRRGLGKYGLSKFRPPRVQIPRMNVPTLKNSKGNPPSVIRSMVKPRLRESEDSSAERMERLKKGVQKMLHVVKVLGQIDQYLSQRMRIIVDKLSMTFAE